MKDHRSIRRFNIELPMWIKGVDIQGIPFEEATTSFNISSKGAYFMLKREIGEEGELQLQATVSLPRRIRGQLYIKKGTVLRVENCDHGEKKGIAFQFNRKSAFKNSSFI